MYCLCCSLEKIRLNLFGLQQYAVCEKCGFIFSINTDKHSVQEIILHHYSNEDPHSEVAFAKKNFFKSVLEHLSKRVITDERKILDIGCSHGYFLEYTQKRGWKSYGIDVFKEAVKCARDRVGADKIFEGKLKEANFCIDYFDAITLWDVLGIVDDPYDDLMECYRLLKKNGIIGIRTRNAQFQKFAYLIYKPFKQLFLKAGFQEPYVFDEFCFSQRSIKSLLSRIGFQNIKIYNSILTSGDPYKHFHFSFLIKAAKILIDIFSRSLAVISGGKIIIGPTLLIWAKKQ